MTISLTRWNKEHICNKTSSLLCVGLIPKRPPRLLHGVTTVYPIPFHLGQVSRTTRGWLASAIGHHNESRTEGLWISRSRHPDFEDLDCERGERRGGTLRGSKGDNGSTTRTARGRKRRQVRTRGSSWFLRAARSQIATPWT